MQGSRRIDIEKCENAYRLIQGLRVIKNAGFLFGFSFSPCVFPLAFPLRRATLKYQSKQAALKLRVFVLGPEV